MIKSVSWEHSSWIPIRFGFGNVIASLSAESTILLTLIYGIGTALPVIGFAVLIATGSNKLGTAFNAMGRVER